VEKPPSSAEVAYRRADERGDPGGAYNLGMLLGAWVAIGSPGG